MTVSEVVLPITAGAGAAVAEQCSEIMSSSVTASALRSARTHRHGCLLADDFTFMAKMRLQISATGSKLKNLPSVFFGDCEVTVRATQATLNIFGLYCCLPQESVQIPARPAGPIQRSARIFSSWNPPDSRLSASEISLGNLITLSILVSNESLEHPFNSTTLIGKNRTVCSKPLIFREASGFVNY